LLSLFFQAEDGIRDFHVTGVQTCALPIYLWHKNEDGQFARGIQYPILKPEEGEWHSPWSAYLLEPSKEAIRKVLRYHITHPESQNGRASCSERVQTNVVAVI